MELDLSDVLLLDGEASLPPWSCDEPDASTEDASPPADLDDPFGLFPPRMTAVAERDVSPESPESSGVAKRKNPHHQSSYDAIEAAARSGASLIAHRSVEKEDETEDEANERVKKRMRVSSSPASKMIIRFSAGVRGRQRGLVPASSLKDCTRERVAEAWCIAVRNKNVETVMRIGQLFPSIVNVRDSAGKNAFTFACESYCAELCAPLCSLGVEFVVDQYGSHPIMSLMFAKCCEDVYRCAGAIAALVTNENYAHMRTVRSRSNKVHAWVEWFPSTIDIVHPLRDLIRRWTIMPLRSMSGIHILLPLLSKEACMKEMQCAVSSCVESMYDLALIVAEVCPVDVCIMMIQNGMYDAVTKLITSARFDAYMRSRLDDRIWYECVSSRDLRMVLDMLLLFEPPARLVHSLLDYAIKIGWTIFVHCMMNRDAMRHFGAECSSLLIRRVRRVSLETLLSYCVRAESAEAARLRCQVLDPASLLAFALVGKPK